MSVGVACGQLDVRLFLNTFDPYLVPILFHQFIPTFPQFFSKLLMCMYIVHVYLCCLYVQCN